ncbi:ABC transporter substrate-binding protein [Corynebacterium pacaense]|uniref:ABC transporter substrate-binding protein n=1 Tax=Corynebacterium pacaense TaxID=1816684 RepID=UPI0009BB4D74|nr:ABC transporter substrate-binding protein [Corynebacterium pacaense]
MSKSRTLAAIIIASSLTVVACSSGDTTTSTPTAAQPAGNYPVTVDSCGNSVVVDRAPERAVALNQGITEILLSMGLGDRVVGTATWTDPVLPELEKANETIPRLADNDASLETVLATEPDLVAASFASTLSDGASGSFDSYARVGVPAYIAHSDCVKSRLGNDDGERGEKLGMDDIYRDIEDLGLLFDAPTAAQDLVNGLDARMTAVRAEGEPLTAAFWFANSESPYMAGGYGAPQIIADQLNLDNVFADRTEEWPQINWEAVAQADPDVLVLGDLTRKSQTAETGDAKVEFLKNHPVASQMSAVRNNRIIYVAGADMNPSIRTVDGAEKVAAGLRELGLR